MSTKAYTYIFFAKGTHRYKNSFVAIFLNNFDYFLQDHVSAWKIKGCIAVGVVKHHFIDVYRNPKKF
jgi:hypothetical protein